MLRARRQTAGQRVAAVEQVRLFRERTFTAQKANKVRARERT
jgi:hypothetical protein